MELKIKPEYERLNDPLTPEEYEALKESIKKEGQKVPIVVNKQGIILDGHHRFKICKELGIEPKYRIEEHEDEIEYVLIANLLRRHYNAFQKAERGMFLYEREKKKAKERQLKGFPPDGRKGEATEFVAKEIGLSKRTFERALKVIKEGSEIVKKKLRNEEWSINYAYQGYCLLDDVTDDEKKEELKDQFENEEITLQELNKIIQNTLVAYEWLGSTAPSISKELEEKYEDSFWTADLDLKQFEHDLKEKEGAPVPLKEVEIVSTKFQSRKDAEAFFKKCGGYLVGTRVYYVGKIDPLKYQE